MNYQRASMAIGIALALTSVAFAAEATGVPDVPKPKIPDKTFKITDYGAVSDGKTLNTAAIAKTIEAATKAGGGKVVIPSGKFLSAAIKLDSNIDFHLDDGAALLLSNNFDDYHKTNAGYENQIVADNCHDVAVTGAGTIDGQGDPWWAAFLKVKGKTREEQGTFSHRPYMVQIRNCTRVLVQDVTLTNSPMFHLVPQQCHDVTIDHVTFAAPERAPNTDALDPSGWNFLIQNCTFDVGDDCIAIKASGKPQGDVLSCENFYVTKCTFKHGHGCSIGGQTPGGLRHLVVRDSTFENTDAGIRMKAPRGNGGLVEDCLYENLTMKHVKFPIYITSYYPENTAPKNAADDPAQPVTDKTPIWKNITIRNVTATDNPNSGRILGLAEMKISDVTLENVKIEGDKPFDLWNCKGIKFVNSAVTVNGGKPALDVQESSEITGIDPKSGKPQ